MFKVGVDVFGRKSGHFYDYSNLKEAPKKLVPFAPVLGSALFPSPWSIQSLHSESSSPRYPFAEREFSGPIRAAVLQHGRFWLLLENGRLVAYSAETLEPVSAFEGADWPDTSHLAISGHLLYGWGSKVIRVTDAATAEPEPPALICELDALEVYFEGQMGAALGIDRAGGRFVVRPLRASPSNTETSADIRVKYSSESPRGRTWWGMLGSQSYLLCPDGVIRRLDDEGVRYEVVWHNEGRAKVGIPKRYQDGLFFPVQRGETLSVVQLSASGLQEHELANRGGEACIEVIKDDLYFLQREDQRLLGCLHLPTGRFREPLPLLGSSELTEIRLQRAAIQGEPQAVVYGRTATMWRFWGVHAYSKEIDHQLAGSPSAQEDLSLFWEGANTWMLVHNRRGKGYLWCLPIQPT